MFCHRLRAFTLIELLVVIAIIAILAAILFPVFTKVREKARQSNCMNNQRQLAIAIRMYIDDHDGLLPDANTWKADCDNLPPMTFSCPTAGKSKNGYVYNAALSNQPENFNSPDKVMLTADGSRSGGATISWAEGITAWYSAGAGVTTDDDGKVQEWSTRFMPTYTQGMDLTAANICFDEKDIAYRHTGKTIMSFLDGHVEPTDGVPSSGGGEPFTMTTADGGSAEGPSTPPTLVADGLTGKPTIRFVAEDRTCLKNSKGIGVNLNRDDYTVIMVRNMNPPATVPGSYSTLISVPGVAIRVRKLHYLLGDGSVDEQSFTTTPAICMWSLVVSGSSYNTYLGGAPQDNGTLQRNMSARDVDPAFIGREVLNWPSYNTFPATMDLSELLVFKRALSSAEIAVVHSRLLEGYAIP
jgi:prepilin-type N-terminal cleavage/methylation domain-containing protein/prepilin-type processing-associated H-X9-DG protein